MSNNQTKRGGKGQRGKRERGRERNRKQCNLLKSHSRRLSYRVCSKKSEKQVRVMYRKMTEEKRDK